MLHYQQNLKKHARTLRANLTDSEHRLWYLLRRKQMLGIQFFRQRPIGNYIVDFYAPTVKLVIEIDGSQHFEETHRLRDEQRDEFLNHQNIKVLRFNSSETLTNSQGVYEAILKVAEERQAVFAEY